MNSWILTGIQSDKNCYSCRSPLYLYYLETFAEIGLLSRQSC